MLVRLSDDAAPGAGGAAVLESGAEVDARGVKAGALACSGRLDDAIAGFGGRPARPELGRGPSWKDTVRPDMARERSSRPLGAPTSTTAKFVNARGRRRTMVTVSTDVSAAVLGRENRFYVRPPT